MHAADPRRFEEEIKMRWLETFSNAESTSRSVHFWEGVREDLKKGEFWADQIKAFRIDPDKRLSLALDNLPLPASFREAAIALRAKIRKKRKGKEQYTDELESLYHLAVIESFMIGYAPRLKEPGFNVMESCPGGSIAKLPYDYKSMGFDRLKLLNKTDKKWIVESWEEPDEHSTLHEMHKKVWNHYEDLLIQKRKQSDDEFISFLREAKKDTNKPEGTARKWWEFWKK